MNRLSRRAAGILAAWLGHARDPRLLVARYRHAVPKDAGRKWCAVRPTDAAKAATRMCG